MSFTLLFKDKLEHELTITVIVREIQFTDESSQTRDTIQCTVFESSMCRVLSGLCRKWFMDILFIYIAHSTFIQMWQCLYSQFLLPFITRFPGETFKGAKEIFACLPARRRYLCNRHGFSVKFCEETLMN